MNQLSAYISFEGNAEEAMSFYANVFQTELSVIMRWGENPQCEAFSDEDKHKVMHTHLAVGNTAVLASDHLSSFGMPYTPGNNFAIAVAPDSRAEADRIFKELSDDGTTTMPMTDMFWGGYFGSLTDKYGVQWMLNYDTSQDK